jgi:hypothetical protein
MVNGVHLSDLEDDVLRVRWMSEIANDQLQNMPCSALGDEFDKLCHLVRATAELAKGLSTKMMGSAQ